MKKAKRKAKAAALPPGNSAPPMVKDIRLTWDEAQMLAYQTIIWDDPQELDEIYERRLFSLDTLLAGIENEIRAEPSQALLLLEMVRNHLRYDHFQWTPAAEKAADGLILATLGKTRGELAAKRRKAK